MVTRLRLIGVPSAPGHMRLASSGARRGLRAAGLAGALATAGVATFDAGDLPGLACLTLTEINPGHDPAGELSQELVSRWTAAIAAGLTR